ncbi:LLM class flavin-dependent oxidoreductase [Nocardia terpenica]|uniref:Monooxygenase n=2 Tax=Nocardia terpenica TaxID=455432 RepID=A0A0U1Z262_9NOCA|nr:LLM class flavin-dependent oxidoreductase [Nocardia terpenica]AJO72767.1 Monooxygenase [Nocardia terpenica]KZM75385.1 monooxygenase [Nocardia terpenica]MBF6063776.1 LLM class flavin-dependent oxidoreductase [Nocardia terpenica]MBF6107152.1 LLM class flavin-dependent oxidoreductase [Nocardia terpenica]MBF6114325.1 LLM class flavin-dependent oxidoreductase [Nocardia terpenica]
MTATTRKPIVSVGYELPRAGMTGPARALLAVARAAEAAGVDYLVLPDRPAADPGGASAPAAAITAALLASGTEHLGVVVSTAIAYWEPYNLARVLASLDHISAGRAGWQVVTALDAAADANHRRAGFDPAANREARAIEYVPLVRDLWDSWEDGAFVHDKDSGCLVDVDRIHVLGHAGPALQVRGPLNVARPPQGHPVVFAAATDPLVASAADVLTTGRPGATDRPHRVLAVEPFVAADTRRAHELHGAAGTPEGDADRAVVVGAPAAVADRLLGWADSVDGFLVRFATLDQLAAFTDLVLPRLRAAGSPEPAGPRSLRARLGLARPANRLVATAAAERS